MHYDIIYVALHEIYPFENMVHDSLKEYMCILQSKRLHKPFPQLVTSMECHFLVILYSEHNLVKALPQIHNCEDVWASNFIKQFFKDGHGVLVLSVARFKGLQSPHIFFSVHNPTKSFFVDITIVATKSKLGGWMTLASWSFLHLSSTSSHSCLLNLCLL